MIKLIVHSLAMFWNISEAVNPNYYFTFQFQVSCNVIEIHINFASVFGSPVEIFIQYSKFCFSDFLSNTSIPIQPLFHRI